MSYFFLVWQHKTRSLMLGGSFHPGSSVQHWWCDLHHPAPPPCLPLPPEAAWRPQQALKMLVHTAGPHKRALNMQMKRVNMGVRSLPPHAGTSPWDLFAHTFISSSNLLLGRAYSSPPPMRRVSPCQMSAAGEQLASDIRQLAIISCSCVNNLQLSL